MTIKIIEEKDIYITEAERDRYLREWEQANQYTTAPISFESFVRIKKSEVKVP